MPLAFFQPYMLWGLAALAVPLLIHFFNRKRTVKLDFSSLRFFTATAVVADRTRSVKRWLQLLLRLALVGALVFVFARPHDP